MASGGEDPTRNLAKSEKMSITNANLYSDKISIDMDVDEETASASAVLQSLLQEAGIKKNHSTNKPIFVNKACPVKRSLADGDTET